MAQTKQELNTWYSEEDPWKYKTSSDDQKRKDIIISFIEPCNRILDLGAGEGWITKDLPAKEIEAIEISDLAASRMPLNIKRVFEPVGMYDYIIACGILYSQYSFQTFLDIIIKHAYKAVIAGIEDWLVPHKVGTLIKETSFKYRQYNQIVELYEVNS